MVGYFVYNSETDRWVTAEADEPGQGGNPAAIS